MLIILINCIFLIVNNQSNTSELIFLIFYSIEMFMKIISQGFILNSKSYLRNNWNQLDFFIVISGFLDVFFDSSVNFGGLRAFRILRPLRTISFIKNLRVLLITLFSALPLLKDTLVILGFFFIVYAIAGLNLFSGQLKNRCVIINVGILKDENLICGYVDCPKDSFCSKLEKNPNWGFTNFDNFLYSFLQIFQCITLEGWSEINSMISDSMSPYYVIYFITSVLFGSYFIIGITLAVIKAQFTETHSKLMTIGNNDKSFFYKKNNKFIVKLKDAKNHRRLIEYKKLKNKKRRHILNEDCLTPKEKIFLCVKNNNDLNKMKSFPSVSSVDEEFNNIKKANSSEINDKKFSYFQFSKNYNLEKNSTSNYNKTRFEDENFEVKNVNSNTDRANNKSISFIKKVVQDGSQPIKLLNMRKNTKNKKMTVFNYKNDEGLVYNPLSFKVEKKEFDLRILLENNQEFSKQEGKKKFDEIEEKAMINKKKKIDKYLNKLKSKFIKVEIKHQNKYKSSSLTDVLFFR